MNEEERTKAFAALHEKREARQALRLVIEKEGETALRRLFDIAHDHSGQSHYVAGFLLGLYDGGRFRFDLTDLRCLDADIFDDCIAVLKMDSQPRQEVHKYFDNGGYAFEQLARDWEIEGYVKES